MDSSIIRVLYVEDNAQDADLVRSHFMEHVPDIELDIVTTGQACLDRLYQTKPDVLLLDHQLPDMNGLNVLKALIHMNIQVPVVMVTGMGEEELVIKALRLGAVNYVPKTIDYPRSLPDILLEVAEEHQRKLKEGLLTPVARKILYVEHNSMDIELTLAHFSEAAPHFMIDVARSCGEALQRLRDGSAYDLILIDLRMPDQSGLDFIRETRQYQLELPPFIIISGKGEEGTAIATLKLGAADYVVKRENYLSQLIYTIDRAIAYKQLSRLNQKLQVELLEHKRTEERRKTLETQLFHAQKMEAIGRLAGSIAHDFNNILAVILGCSESLLNKLDSGSPLREDVQEIMLAGQRSAALTHQLLAFSRKQEMKTEVLDLNIVVQEFEKMLYRVIGKDVELIMKLCGKLPAVLADRGQVEQIIMNLAVNAHDAMPEGGSLIIETADTGLDDRYVSENVNGMEARYVVLSVTDTGIGMNKETLSRLFEPFFTTKSESEGTGLGLATVYGIVKQSGGNIQVKSQPGVGSTFKIFLPCYDASHV